MEEAVLMDEVHCSVGLIFEKLSLCTGKCQKYDKYQNHVLIKVQYKMHSQKHIFWEYTVVVGSSYVSSLYIVLVYISMKLFLMTVYCLVQHYFRSVLELRNQLASYIGYLNIVTVQ